MAITGYASDDPGWFSRLVEDVDSGHNLRSTDERMVQYTAGFGRTGEGEVTLEFITSV